MGRSVLEDGPRLGVQADGEDLQKLEEGLIDAGYVPWNRESEGERRYRHPGGSTARVFPTPGLAYVYPPGGTRHQTGPIQPFTPLKRECADANARAGFGPDEATADAGPGDPSPDASTHDDEADTDGDD